MKYVRESLLYYREIASNNELKFHWSISKRIFRTHTQTHGEGDEKLGYLQSKGQSIIEKLVSKNKKLKINYVKYGRAVPFILSRNGER